jgi:hypothetical protein
MTDVAAFAETGMFAGRYPGNIILTGTQSAWPDAWTAALTARGPHPAKVLVGVEHHHHTHRTAPPPSPPHHRTGDPAGPK